MFKKKYLPFVLILSGVFLIGVSLVLGYKLRDLHSSISSQRIKNGLTPADIAKNAHPAPTALPTPSPSPRPLTFEELNAMYGPCLHLPVLFYHHIQNMDVARAAGQQNLTVATDIFIKQMQYLKDKGYIPQGTNAVSDFFDKGIVPPARSLLLTFDDGYEDFYVNVVPILQQMGFKGILALPTGLVGNPGYLTWDEISQAAGAGIEIINHTWSHANLATSNTGLIQREISTANDQLTSRGYNQNKAFVYPYGTSNAYDVTYLQSKGYTMAFTTVPGSTLCKKQRFTLPRIRIGNASLSAYGF